MVARADKETKDNPTTLLMGAYYDFGFMKLMAAYQKGWDLDRIGAFQGGSKLTIGGKNSIVRYFDADFYMLGATVPAGKGLVRLSALYMTGEMRSALPINPSLMTKQKPDTGRSLPAIPIPSASVRAFTERCLICRGRTPWIKSTR